MNGSPENQRSESAQNANQHIGTEKKCFKCGKTKQLSEFYKHPQMADGHVNKCKECNKKDVAENYQVRREQFAAYEKQRYQNSARRKAALEYQRIRRARSPEKYRATMAVSNALKSGRLIKEPCAVCGNPKTQAHHDDYSKPLDVRWLCRRHHLEFHGKQAYEF